MPTDRVMLASYTNPLEADMAKFILEQEGVVVFLDNRFIVATDWFLSNAVGGIRLEVPSQDAERAAGILSEIRPWPGMPRESTADNEATRCLACGAIMPDDADVCRACGWTFAAEEEPS